METSCCGTECAVLGGGRSRTITMHLHPSQQQATHKVLNTTSCMLEPDAPGDGLNYCPKHVELTLEF